MNTRMQKYNDIPDANMSRTKRNQEIYKSTDMAELSRFKSNANVSVISDAPKEINIEKIKNYIESLEDGKEEKRRRLDIDIPEEKEEVVERQEIKNYDINSVLEKARENKEVDYEEERHRSISNTQYSILKSIKIEDEDEDEEEDSLNTEEKTIVDLIQDIQKNSKKEKDEEPEDLFKELMGDSDDTVVMAPITEDEINTNSMKETLADITTDLEKIKEPVNDQTQELLLEKERLKQKHMEEEKKKEEVKEEPKEDTDTFASLPSTTNTSKIKTIDKSFYTNSMSFTKTDFEGFDELEKNANSGVFTKIAIVVAVLLLIATVFLILNFVLDWNII